MKTIVQHGFGPAVLQLVDADAPRPGAGEVLVRQRASSVNSADWHFVTGTPLVMRLAGAPKGAARGMDVAGVVEAVGADVTRIAPGDEVWGTAERGAWAELVLVKEERIASKPATLAFERAGAVPLAATTAFQAIRDVGCVEAGQRVLVIGASGGVGTFAVQIAKALGASVSGVARGGKADVVRDAGAERVFDYTSGDFTGGATYDVVVDLVASRPLSELRRALTPAGTLVLAGGGGGRYTGPMRLIAHAAARAPFARQSLRSFTAKHTRARLDAVAALIDSGKVRPVIERAWPLDDTAAAMRWFDEGKARGKLAIAIA